MFLSVTLAGQMSCILIDVSVYLRFLGNRSLYLSAYQAVHRRRQSCNLSFSLPSFCLMVLSLSISDTSTCRSPSLVIVKIHPNIFSVTKKGGSVSVYIYTLKAYIFLTLVGPAIFPDISSCVPALWKCPAYNQWHAIPRYNFVQHGSAGRGGIYCSKSFAAVERLELSLRETHENVLIFVFYAALREMLQVSLQHLDVRILTCRCQGVRVRRSHPVHPAEAGRRTHGDRSPRRGWKAHRGTEQSEDGTPHPSRNSMDWRHYRVGPTLRRYPASHGAMTLKYLQPMFQNPSSIPHGFLTKVGVIMETDQQPWSLEDDFVWENSVQTPIDAFASQTLISLLG